MNLFFTRNSIHAIFEHNLFERNFNMAKCPARGFVDMFSEIVFRATGLPLAICFTFFSKIFLFFVIAASFTRLLCNLVWPGRAQCLQNLPKQWVQKLPKIIEISQNIFSNSNCEFVGNLWQEIICQLLRYDLYSI